MLQPRAYLFGGMLAKLNAFGAMPSVCRLRSRSSYPGRTPSITEVAQRLGFEEPTDMYPEYPLESPPKLWFVKQTHKLKYRPFWEKEAMKDMGLYRIHDISVQMNTPSTNEKLWLVKHLIQIKPIRFPDGLPTKEDIGGTRLTHKGEFIIYKNRTEMSVEDELAPMPSLHEWKVVDGFRMCKNCKQRRCYKYQMCEKVWLQRGKNNLERIGPAMFNYVDSVKKDDAVNEGTPEEQTG